MENFKSGKGHSSAFLKIGPRPVVEIQFIDQFREGTEEYIKRLHELGLRLVILSGDSKTVVAQTAKDLGIKEWYGEVNPKETLQMIRDIFALGGGTVMIGDRLNDAAAMSLADIALASASTMDVTRVTADIAIPVALLI